VSIPKAAEEAAIEPTTKSRAGQVAPRVTHKLEQNATTKLYSIHMSSKAVGVVHKTGDNHKVTMLLCCTNTLMSIASCVTSSMLGVSCTALYA
jgi:hypothetical protein